MGAARGNSNAAKIQTPWKWYVYQFFIDDLCVYVGKGSGSRFKLQSRRFSSCVGYIAAHFKKEAHALEHERALIKTLSPQFNKAMMPFVPSPWKYSLLPPNQDFYTWCDVLGSKQMAARIVVAKGRAAIERLGVDYQRFVDIVAPTIAAQSVPVCASR